MKSASFPLLFFVVAAAGVGLGMSGEQNQTGPNVRFGVCDWTIGKSGDPASLELASKLGLEGVQVSLVVKDDSLLLARESLQRSFRDAVKKTGVEIVSLAIGDLNNIPYKSDPRAERWLDQSIDISRAMGVKVILVPFFGKADLRKDPSGTSVVIERLKKVAPKAEKAGVILALESMLSAEDQMKIIEAVGSPAVGVYYDVGNSQDAGYDIRREIRQLGSRICEFHAKDTKGLYGKGSMDFRAVREAMEAIGYHGWLILEGTELSLGIEKSILYDMEHLRSVFMPGKK